MPIRIMTVPFFDVFFVFVVCGLGFCVFVGPILSILSFFYVFGGLGGSEWSKTIRWTRTIILVPLIPHIDHSRPRSTPFWVSQAKLPGAFGAWGETFQENRPWDFDMAWNYEIILAQVPNPH